LRKKTNKQRGVKEKRVETDQEIKGKERSEYSTFLYVVFKEIT